METLAIWLILCLAVFIIAWIMRSMPISIVSSFGLIITGCKYYLDDPDLFVLAMMFMLAFSLPFVVQSRNNKR